MPMELGARNSALSPTGSWTRRAWRELRRRLFPPSLQVLLSVLLLLLVIVLVLQYLPSITLWHDANQACREGELGCGLITHVVGTGIVALLLFNFVFLRRETRAASWWRSRAQETPEALFSWLPPLGGVTGLAAAARRAPPETRARNGNKADAPAMLAPPPRSLIANVVGREPLVMDLASELAEGDTPLIVVGPTGSGKTMVLLALTQYLAVKGQVPVPVSMRNGDTINFERAARAAFHEAFPQRTEEEADKQWRWLRRDRLITVIVDDLEKSRCKPADVVRALDAAAAAKLRIVAASRPNGIPANFTRGRVDLPELRPEDVVNNLMERVASAMGDSDSEPVRRVLDETRERVRKIVEDANVPSTPYYLAIGQVLADTGRLQKLARVNRGAARLELLNEYRAAVASTLRPEAALSEDTRKRVLDGLEVIAYARLWCGSTVEEVAAAADELERRSSGDGTRLGALDTRVVVEYAQRLGILEHRFDGVVWFGHPTTLAYFASSFLIKRGSDFELWTRIIERRRVSSTASLAFVFAAAGVGDADVVAAICRALLARRELMLSGVSSSGRLVATRDLFGSPELSQNGVGEHTSAEDGRTSDWPPGFYDRVLLLKTAAEVARNPGGLKDDVAAKTLEIMEAEPDRNVLVAEQIRLVQEIALLECSSAYDVLWNFATTGGEYRVRRAALRAILTGRPRAVAIAADKVGAAVEAAEDYQRCHPAPAEDDREEPFQTLRAVAWALPCLRGSATDDDAYRLAGYQDSLSGLARSLSDHRGLEASIAQGLKLEAFLHPQGPPDPLALEMLGHGDKRAEFWFSRVLLVQAVTRRWIASENKDDALARLHEIRQDEAEHPFVRETAQLCATGVEAGSWKPYVPIDMTEVAAGEYRDLELSTMQLVGDIVLALNLNDQAPPQARIDFGQSGQLPHCLEHSASRHEILGLASPSTDCPFHDGDRCLCPHTYDPPSGGIRRELSRAFCRELRLHAEPAAWHSKIRADALKEFWHELEARARF
jgi:hypothetical protein